MVFAPVQSDSYTEQPVHFACPAAALIRRDDHGAAVELADRPDLRGGPVPASGNLCGVGQGSGMVV